MKQYEFHPEAEGDLNSIWDYIAEHSPDAADRTMDKLLAAIEALLPFPHQGHRRPDLTSRPLRFISAGNYLIAYAPDKDPLRVIAVMHGHRSPRVMAAILRGRESAQWETPARKQGDGRRRQRKAPGGDDMKSDVESTRGAGIGSGAARLRSRECVQQR